MKKIHCYISSLEGGGAERQMTYLCTFLAEKGYDVTLITLLDAADKYSVSPSVKRLCIGYRLNDNVIIKLWKKIKLFFFFLTLRTDCIISFLIGSNEQVLRPMRFRPKIKVIVSERNLVTWELSEYEKWVYGNLYNRANYVVSNSFSMKQYLANYNSKLNDRLVTIINYTDLGKYTNCPPVLGDKMVIGVFARFQKQKNYERFAEMLSIIKSKEHRPFVVKWYGEKNRSEYSNFCDLIQEYGIQDLIELHDFATDVSDVMRNIDVICLPSIYEGFSNSIAEAICCGKPVIASDVSDNGQMVKNLVNGFLFNPLNVDEMANVFLRAIQSPDDLLAKMGVQSRALAENLFSKDSFVNSYVELIEA